MGLVSLLQSYRNAQPPKDWSSTQTSVRSEFQALGTLPQRPVLDPEVQIRDPGFLQLLILQSIWSKTLKLALITVKARSLPYPISFRMLALQSDASQERWSKTVTRTPTGTSTLLLIWKGLTEMQAPSETGDQKAPSCGNSLKSQKGPYVLSTCQKLCLRLNKHDSQILLEDREKCNVFI